MIVSYVLRSIYLKLKVEVFMEAYVPRFQEPLRKGNHTSLTMGKLLMSISQGVMDRTCTSVMDWINGIIHVSPQGEPLCHLKYMSWATSHGVGAPRRRYVPIFGWPSQIYHYKNLKDLYSILIILLLRPKIYSKYPFCNDFSQILLFLI